MLWTTSTLDHTCFYTVFWDHIRLKFTIHTVHKGCFCLSSVVSKHNCPTAVSPQCSIKPAQRRWLSILGQCTFTSSSLGLGYYEAVFLFVGLSIPDQCTFTSSSMFVVVWFTKVSMPVQSIFSCSTLNLI